MARGISNAPDSPLVDATVAQTAPGIADDAPLPSEEIQPRHVGEKRPCER